MLQLFHVFLHYILLKSIKRLGQKDSDKGAWTNTNVYRKEYLSGNLLKLLSSLTNIFM